MNAKMTAVAKKRSYLPSPQVEGQVYIFIDTYYA